ncbi:DEAD/DEAH box helicase [Candidatus Micrarchaeota archaeon]|nr:DEAD/DEAH box helicase [Candidatus Micrarchaeota archaeon]
MHANISELVKKANGFSDFNPVQQKALQANLFNQNLVIASPTASGKTLIAELCALDSIIEKHQKVVYTCPLRALASEHYSDFKKKYAGLKVRMALSTGELDSSSKYLSNYDFVFCTNEKLNSLIRHKADWLKEVGLLVVDEVHLLGSDRGPTLEIVIAMMQLVNPKIRLLALSATIPNAKQISDWLQAKLVKSDYRPVKLEEGVFFDNELVFPKRVQTIPSKERDPLSQLADNTLNQEDQQCLVFANSRRNSQSMAKKMGRLTALKLTPKKQAVLERVSQRILTTLEQPTSQCMELAELVKKGIAFHHAGLLQKQRQLVEDAFKKDYLKIICATPTLALGVNIPAFRVIVPSLYRYTKFGNQRISVSEYKQWIGRAGRPAFHVRGEGILLAHSELEADELLEFFVKGELEDIESQLSQEPVLRTHLLAAIATNFIFDLQSLEEFFSKTFFAFQYKNTSALFKQLSTILTELQELGFVKGNEKRFEATPLGKRVAELYLDPLAAHELVQSLKQNRLFSPLTYLFLFVQTKELFPLVSLPKKKESAVLEDLVASKDELPINLERDLYADPELGKKFFTARMLEEWINERPDPLLTEDFNTAPGLLHSKLWVCDWLGYAAFELCQLLGLEKHLPKLGKLRKRLKHGVKEELLSLVEVRGIGRVRARKLWHNNVRSVSELKKMDIKDLSRLLGETIAFKIKQNLGQKTEKTISKTKTAKEQSSLKVFD